MLRLAATLALPALLTSTAVQQTLAQDINTGDPSGAYHGTFCPRLEMELRQARFNATCKTSLGTGENLKRVMAEPRQIGFGQLDILALEGALTGTPPPVTVLRREDARECLFAVTRNKDVAAYGDLAANAAKLRFFLPPADSGSAGTFRYLRAHDPDGLGRAGTVIHAATTDEALRQALAADDTVALFVQFPDPDNPRFKLVADQGGHFVPVIDRALLRPQVGGEKIYFAQETEVANASWSKAGTKVVTACTPMVVFTGHPDRITGEKAQQDHRDLIATVKAIKPETLLPPESGFSRILKRTRELSATSAEQVLKMSEEAREKAKPWLDRALEAGGKAIEAAKPAIDKAAEMGKQAIDKAKQEAKEILDATKPAEPKTEPKK